MVGDCRDRIFVVGDDLRFANRAFLAGCAVVVIVVLMTYVFLCGRSVAFCIVFFE